MCQSAKDAGAKLLTHKSLEIRVLDQQHFAPAGDLFVVTHVEPSSVYERRGNDLLVTVTVSYADAALGATVEVPTPRGTRYFEILEVAYPGEIRSK